MQSSCTMIWRKRYTNNIKTSKQVLNILKEMLQDLKIVNALSQKCAELQEKQFTLQVMKLIGDFFKIKRKEKKYTMKISTFKKI